MDTGVDSGVYIAYRGWECRFEHNKAGRLILRSTGKNTPWHSAEMTATCDNCVEEAPNPSCGCGIYALKDPALLRKKVKGMDEGWVYTRWSSEITMMIYGTVILWGDTIIEGEEGYRAQHARMETLIVPTQDTVPSHLKHQKTWVPIDLDVKKLAGELHASYGVPVIEDTDMIFYWKMPEPIPSALREPGSGKRAGVPQFDTRTGMVYRSKSAAGKVVAAEYGMDPYDSYVWYAIIRDDPRRFRDATKADVDKYNDDHPFSPLFL